jgi:hypothetical protein
VDEANFVDHIMLLRSVIPAPCVESPTAVRTKTWWPLAKRWLRHRSAAHVFVLDDLTARLPGHDEPFAEGYSFRVASYDDLAQCAPLADLPAEEYVRRWDHGDRCYTVFWQGRPVHLGWLHFGSVYVCGVGLPIEAGPLECYLYNVMTAPEHRRRGLYRATQRRVAAMLAGEGVRRVTQLVTTSNLIPQVALPQLGYRLLYTVRHTTLCGRKLTAVHDAKGRLTSVRLFFRTPKAVFRI